MTNDGMQKLGKGSTEMALTALGAWTKNAQAIAVEVADYSKKSFENSASAWEQLLGAKTVEKSMEVQGEYLRSWYQGFVAEAAKVVELYVDLAKEVYKPFEGALAKSPSMK
jgi:hypothetical protein